MAGVRGRLLGVLVAGLVIVACGNDDSSQPDRTDASPSASPSSSRESDADDVTTTSETAEQPGGSDAEIAAAAVLRATDVPGDWSARPEEEASDLEGTVARVAECMDLDASDLIGQAATADSPTLITPGEHEISNTVKVFETEDDAVTRFALGSSPEYRTCFRDELGRLLRDRATDEVRLAEPEIQEATPKNLGDESTAMRITFTFEVGGSETYAYQDVVTARQGRATVTVSAFSPHTPLHGDDLAHLMRIVLDRLSDAESEA